MVFDAEPVEEFEQIILVIITVQIMFYLININCHLKQFVENLFVHLTT